MTAEMGLRFVILGSGSRGNAAYLEAGSTRLLIDAGLSARQIRKRVEAAGGSIEGLSGVLITHEHTDHINGLRVFCKRRAIPVFCNRYTFESMPEELAERLDVRLFENGRPFQLGAVEVESFAVLHDAADPVAFLLRTEEATLAIATDLGHATTLVRQRLRAAHVLVLESNHDVRMLQDHPRRPWSLKQRILSRHGHLSNEAAGEVIREVVSERLRKLYLGHLSRECNRPELALESALGALEEAGARHVEVEVACQERPASPFVA